MREWSAGAGHVNCLCFTFCLFLFIYFSTVHYFSCLEPCWPRRCLSRYDCGLWSCGFSHNWGKQAVLRTSPKGPHWIPCALIRNRTPGLLYCICINIYIYMCYKDDWESLLYWHTLMISLFNKWGRWCSFCHRSCLQPLSLLHCQSTLWNTWAACKRRIRQEQIVRHDVAQFCMLQHELHSSLSNFQRCRGLTHRRSAYRSPNFQEKPKRASRASSCWEHSSGCIIAAPCT